MRVRTDESLKDQRIYTDEAKACQTLMNLISNAAKFTTVGYVEVSADKKDDGIQFSVMDSGPGIAREDRDRIFESFTQVDASATRTHGGSGLGLAISREMTELLEGELSLESQPGKGSTFHLSLPMHHSQASK